MGISESDLLWQPGVLCSYGTIFTGWIVTVGSLSASLLESEIKLAC